MRGLQPVRAGGR